MCAVDQGQALLRLKLQGRHAFSSHILGKKSPKRKRSFGLDRNISPADRQTVKRLLGGNGR